MKNLLTAVSYITLISLALSSNASADCSDGQLVKNPKNLIGGHTVCVTNPEKSQEYHDGNNGGDLIDYKLGASDPIDPTKIVGTWSAGTGNSNTITYIYGTSGSYTFQIFESSTAPGTDYWYCNGPSANPTIKIDNIFNGQGQC